MDKQKLLRAVNNDRKVPSKGMCTIVLTVGALLTILLYKL